MLNQWKDYLDRLSYPDFQLLLRMTGEQSVTSITQRSKSTEYVDVAEGLLTEPVKCGNSSRWPDGEVKLILAARIAGHSTSEIQLLVLRITELRKTATLRFASFSSPKLMQDFQQWRDAGNLTKKDSTSKEREES